ncbi:PREDICTED: uncharacterized protein CXorf49-like, partial [Chinchilla lanigera]|uniref:uncharacterized protein CXorf49-like n=1 Tax=Chinchilla lanigera TaxID=34839 RepID=UPI00069801E3
MSSPSDVSSPGTGFGPEDRKQSEFRRAAPSTPRAQDLALDVGPPRSGEGEGGVSGRRGDRAARPLYEFNPESEEEELEARAGVPWGCEGRPGSPAEEEEDAARGLVAPLSVECAAGLRHAAHRGAQSARAYPSPPLALA